MNTSFLMNGAKAIKANVRSFQTECASLALDPSIHASIKEELLAASKADIGKSNTGLKEKGWNRLAEIIGMVSPSSVKLMDNSITNKTAVLIKFLKTGTYPSSRTNGAGGSTAVVDGTKAVELTEKGIWSLSKKEQGKEFRALQGEVYDAIMASNKPVRKARKPAANKPETAKPEVVKSKKAPKAA